MVGRVLVHSDLDLESVTGAAVALQGVPQALLKLLYMGVLVLSSVHVLCIILLKGKLECLARLFGASFFVILNTMPCCGFGI